mgnify:CR=1 FL=1
MHILSILIVDDAAKLLLRSSSVFCFNTKYIHTFSASTHRWNVLLEYVKETKGLTVKTLCATSWQSRVNAVKAIRHQTVEVYNALVSIADDVKFS